MSALSTEIDLTPYAALVSGTLAKPFGLQAMATEVRNALDGKQEPMPAAANGTASVLLVDDDPELREGMADVLRRFGYQVTTAPAVADAEALLTTQTFEIVISDWIMPGGTGVDLLERMKVLAPDVPVLLVTAHGTADFAGRMLSAGAADVLLKPFGPKALPVAVEKCLQRRKATAETGPRRTPAQPLDLSERERAAIIHALQTTGGNKVQAAKLLGISRAGLYIKLKVYDLA
jgi:DNA-binding NtrC family response regulator